MRPYLYIDQLSEVTPWTPSAIRTMMSRGVLKLGTHYFKPGGPNARPIFSWAAIVELIEGAGATTREPVRKGIPLANGEVVDIDEAAGQVQALLR